jgi:hypothetical protein
MVELIHGRGQLGEALARGLKTFHVGADCDLYHTWDIDDKSSESQEFELVKFKAFVDASAGRRIFFISGSHERYDPYLMAKLQAEVYLLTRTAQGTVIRLPYIVGKGLAQRIKDGQPYAAGTVEVSSLETMAMRILRCLTSSQRFHVLHGDVVDVNLLAAAIHFGGS